MQAHRINEETIVFTFDEIENYLTSVFLIEKESKIFLVDTFCGPDSMQPILEHIQKKTFDKELIVINTHFHWDHIWGNCSFNGKNIISHELSRKLMDERWETQVSKNSKYLLGDVRKVLPNITFSDRLLFNEDGIELFYSPGHTEDCISVFDHGSKTLYVGDNLEKPLIYVEYSNIQIYIKTLEKYMEYKPQQIIASHTVDIELQDLKNSLEYLKGLLQGREYHFESDYENQIHMQNLKVAGKFD